MMLAALDADDFAMVAEEIAAGRSLNKVHLWLSGTIPMASNAGFVLHCRGVCCCPDGTPLKGLTGG